MVQCCPLSVVVAVIRRAVAAGTVGPVGDWVGSGVAPGVGGLVAVAAPVRRPPLVLSPLAEGGISLSLSFPLAVVAAAVESAVGESVAAIPATVRKAVSTVGASVRQSVANSSVVATEANSMAVAVVRIGLGFRSGSSSSCQSKNKQHLHL